ncbi:hypothetical protein BKA82DRAFT_34047 [Pisolithus tinctorius]|uniref:Uncharacterized protein n=1 Tax=Pisolithus tinctorius Marx 270 TaxID=870435 RepID=A0A0C3NJP3_PISTI|nr:hypothetical protein BKA82DRAFT_34047 [Pisolithus tinctorius]KIN95603.1 hypothetical protein M404DRAFT_34047 [Pisolithus tinctorius Marx 270]
MSKTQEAIELSIQSPYRVWVFVMGGPSGPCLLTVRVEALRTVAINNERPFFGAALKVKRESVVVEGRVYHVFFDENQRTQDPGEACYVFMCMQTPQQAIDIHIEEDIHDIIEVYTELERHHPQEQSTPSEEANAAMMEV